MTPARSRSTLYRTGRHGDTVRVLVDASRDRVEVLYRDVDGKRRKRVYPNDKRGREEAKLWADNFRVEREQFRREGAAPVAISTRALWEAYQKSPAWANLRTASQQTYANRWARWEDFIRRDSAAAKVRATDIDEFIVIASKAGMALNQVRQVFNVARTVYKWGQTRDLLVGTVFAVYRWRQPRDAQPLKPDEYTEAEWQRLIAKSEAQHSRRWRIHVALMLCHATGQRMQAVRHLRWRDIDAAAGVINWPPQFQKQGKALRRPLTWDAIAALETARYWRAEAYAVRARKDRKPGSWPVHLERSDWVLFAMGQKKEAVSYSSLYSALRTLEGLAKVRHRDYRAFHGFRRKVMGDVGEATGDRMLGMEYIGDRDAKQLGSYDRREDNRMRRVAELTEVQAQQSVPKVNPNDALNTVTEPKS